MTVRSGLVPAARGYRGRFAIDWMRLDATGGTADGDRDLVDNWHGHGADVLAMADAEVVAVRDDVEESATLSAHVNPAIADATGNYVALQLGAGRFLFYEHLEPGSIRVRPGDTVTRGQVIARLGFTGSATGPHLHVHVADAGSPLDAEGLPYHLDRFRLLGRYEDFSDFGNARWSAAGAEVVRRDESPPPNSVVEFGDTAARAATQMQLLTKRE